MVNMEMIHMISHGTHTYTLAEYVSGPKLSWTHGYTTVAALEGTTAWKMAASWLQIKLEMKWWGREGGRAEGACVTYDQINFLTVQM